MTVVILAIRNLVGAGIRTWLNAIALSFALFSIIFGQGMLEGMNRQAENASTAFEFGAGQYWHKDYDPYDPLTLESAHDELPPALRQLVESNQAVPILVVQGAAYPAGRLVPVLIKGIDPGQRVLTIPSAALADTTVELPVLLGARMAKRLGLEKGDYVTIQWRSADGAFDARDGRVVEIMNTSVTTIDNGQLWVPLPQLQQLTGLPNHATLLTIAKGTSPPPVTGWLFRNRDFLLADLRQVVRSKTVGQSIMFGILFLLAMLAVFDTQVLSVFRRRQEIGMLVALGMTRSQVILLFTLEGTLQSVLAAVLAALYGSPIFIMLSRFGFQLPGGEGWGLALGERLYPAFTAGLLLQTALLILVATTFVAWLPTRRIARFRPSEALSGRWA